MYDVLERVLRRLLVPMFMIFIGQLDAREEKLFAVDVKVEDQTTSEEQAATRTSLLEVISRLTGLESVPRTAEIKKALDQAESFVSEYVYMKVPNFESEISVASKPLSVLRIVFQPDQIESLLRAAKLPRWPSPRDTCIVWALLENDGRREIIAPGKTFRLVEEKIDSHEIGWHRTNRYWLDLGFLPTVAVLPAFFLYPYRKDETKLLIR